MSDDWENAKRAAQSPFHGESTTKIITTSENRAIVVYERYCQK